MIKTTIAQLQRDFGWRLGKIEQVGQRHCYPLVLQKSTANDQPSFSIDR